MEKSSPQRLENTGGKNRNHSSPAISPFPTVFSKDLYCRHIKTRACFGKNYLSPDSLQDNNKVFTRQYRISVTQGGFLETLPKKENDPKHLLGNIVGKGVNTS